MQQILKIKGEIPTVSHRDIAQGTGNKEKSILDVITRNSSDFEEFGVLLYEVESVKNLKNKTNEVKTYFLNEQQYSLLMTYLRNSEKVKEFKKNMVKAFFSMKEKLQHPASELKELQDKIFKLLEQQETPTATTHNAFLELIYQFNVQAYELEQMEKAIAYRMNGIKGFLSHFAIQYPRSKKYYEGLKKQGENKELRLSIEYDGFDFRERKKTRG